MKLVGVGLGSNLGHREKFLREALAEIQANSLFFEFKSSSIYEAQSVGSVGPDYLNAACVFETRSGAKEVHQFLRQLEHRAGRTRTVPYAPRMLDLDLLFYGPEKINHPDLIVPHPRMHMRAFVLRPLCEVAPSWTHPTLRQTVLQMTEALTLLPIQKIKIYENHIQSETLSKNA